METRQSAPRDAWLHAYEAVYYRLPEDAHIPCPNCGADALELAFVGDPGDSIGYVFFWCGHCQLGLHLDRVDIPAGVEAIPRSASPEELSRRVPSFRFVAPEQPKK